MCTCVSHGLPKCLTFQRELKSLMSSSVTLLILVLEECVKMIVIFILQKWMTTCYSGSHVSVIYLRKSDNYYKIGRRKFISCQHVSWYTMFDAMGIKTAW